MNIELQPCTLDLSGAFNILLNVEGCGPITYAALVLRPLFKTLRLERKLRDWSAVYSGGRHVTIHLWPARATAPIDLYHLIREKLALPNPHGKAEIVPYDPETASASSKSPQRYGGSPKAPRIAKLYCHVETNWILDLELAWKKVSEPADDLEFPLASFFFLTDVFGLSRDETLFMVRDWVDFFTLIMVSQGEEKESVPAKKAFLKQKMEEELVRQKAERPRLFELASRLAESGWRSTPTPEFLAATEPYENAMRRVAACFHREKSDFSPSMPWNRVLSKTYIHWHMLNLRIGGFKELFMMYVIRDTLSMNGSPDSSSTKG